MRNVEHEGRSKLLDFRADSRVKIDFPNLASRAFIHGRAGRLRHPSASRGQSDITQPRWSFAPPECGSVRPAATASILVRSNDADRSTAQYEPGSLRLEVPKARRLF